MYTLGIDMGASAVKVAALTADGELLLTLREAHDGAPSACAAKLVEDAQRRLGSLRCAGFALTGSGAHLETAALSGVRVLEDVPAITQGVRVLAPQAQSVIAVGAQSSYFIIGLERQGAPEFAMNESCAAGTGSFFEDQMNRLGLSIEDYSRIVEQAQGIPRLSGRCTVFAKTDIIHRQQEGVPEADILLGLCYAMVRTYKATIVRGMDVKPPVMLVGGVLFNEGVVRAVREVFALGPDELLAEPEFVFAQAVGAAYEAWGARGAKPPHGGEGAADVADVHTIPAVEQLRDALESSVVQRGLARLAPLPAGTPKPDDGFGLTPRPWSVDRDGLVPCALGVDVGSTSTNLVLVDLCGRVLDAQYLRTRGNPQKAVTQGLADLGSRLGGEVRVVCAGVTGSGRTLIGKLIGADMVRDEITAQARAAAAADPQVDTVFEIGGQDSKFISLSGGRVVDFQMNKICAAGTGSFVEEQAVRLGIPLDEYGDLALSSQVPVDLGERCTVFVETAVNTALAEGAARRDVAAGLCLSIVRNYLHRVVVGKRVGDRVVLQGGVAYNRGIVAAFKAYFGDRVTVSPYFAVSGAVGAALLALEEAFARVSFVAPSCSGFMSNAPALDVAAFDSVSPDAASPDAGFPPTTFRGFWLERDESHQVDDHSAIVEQLEQTFAQTEQAYLAGYDPQCDPSKKTVGVPRCLMMHKLFPMANAFFRHLGFNVVISDASDEDAVHRAQRYAQGEVCFPVKLVYGHMAQLLEWGVDYVFMPRMHTIRHAVSKVRRNFACPYMQVTPRMVADAFDLEARGVELISPVLDMDFGQPALANAMLAVGKGLGRTPQETARAMLAGGFAVQKYTQKSEELGDAVLASLAPDERAVVILTRQYNVSDPVLNMDIPRLFAERGMRVVGLANLRALDVDVTPDHPGLCWPFGQHILAGAKLVRRDPRLFAVYLTNHGCGPDTIMTHLVAREMGDKPYLQIEADEHASKVGVITRIEAFLNSIRSYDACDERNIPTSTRTFGREGDALDSGRACLLPSFGAHGTLVASWLTERGFDVRAVEPSRDALVAGQGECTTKEYASFALTLGMALQGVDVCAGDSRREALRQEESLHPDAQVLMAGTEGSESNVQYDAAVRITLESRNADAHVVAPKLDTLPWSVASAMAGVCDGAGRDAADKDAVRAAIKHADSLFIRLLAGDVVCAAPSNRRGEVLERMLSLGDGLTLEAVELAAREVADMIAPDCGSNAKRLLLVGEWECVFADVISAGLWSRVEAEGHTLVRMPFSEFLWFMWSDHVAEEAAMPALAPTPDTVRGAVPKPAAAVASSLAVSSDASAAAGAATPTKPNTGVSSDAAAIASAAAQLMGGHCGAHDASGQTCGCSNGHGRLPQPVQNAASASAHPSAFAQPSDAFSMEEKRLLLDTYASWMMRVSAALGTASSFAADLDDLRGAADASMGRFAAGNARYRQGKTLCPTCGKEGAARIDGVVCAASMYENADIVMGLLKHEEAPLPVVRLSFDGGLDKSAEEKLRSFLYYL